MPWVNLLIAGIFESVWAISLKYSMGFTKVFPSIVTLIAMFFSFIFLSNSLKTLHVGTAYAVWTGIGAVSTVVLGIILFDEPKNIMRIFFIFLIILGIIGLRFTYTN